MLIQEQFNKLFLLEKQQQPREIFYILEKGKRLKFYNFQKEQQSELQKKGTT